MRTESAMNDKKYTELKKEAQRLKSMGSYFMKSADQLSKVVESINPSNQQKRRKTQTIDELTQIELQNLIK